MKESIVYPGEYIPMPEVEKLLHGIISTHKGYTSKPLVNINEMIDSIKIDVAMPGIAREDLFVYAQCNTITILVLGKGRKKRENWEDVHEFDTECLERHIFLPDQADTDFMSAEFKQGILHLHMPKSREEEPSFTGRQVIVY